MKTKFQTLKNILLVGLVVLTSLSISHSQVITRVLSPDDKLENYIPWYNPDQEVPIVNAPSVDVEEVLEQDQQEGRLLPRISINQETNITIDDGKVFQRSNFLIWNMALVSEGAESISIRLENTYLPEGAEMFIYNTKSLFIVGPISSDDFINGAFRSDYIRGSMVQISIFVPSQNIPSIHISSYDYGVSNPTFNTGASFNTGTFGASQPCNVNVACEEGDGWDCQINSVCRIITDRGTTCSGTIINNDCCDLTPYLLTADHCVREENLNDYLFGFNWQTPECENGEFAPTQWVTYQGAQVVANWGDTDFSLLELNQDIRPADGISFSGWDRRDIIPDEATLIHHPSGDVKKISFDENPQIEEEEIDYGSFIIPADHSYKIFLNELGTNDFGIAEGGTSGCAWFNQQRRIIGTSIGGREPWNCDNENFDWYGGRFHLSWGGDGTPDSRLRDWLGSSENPNTFDCMEHPFVDGTELLCSSSLESFTLVNNNMPCVKNVTWEVKPSNLFSSPTNGAGETATLVSNDNASGAATIRFILSSQDCEDAEIEQSFWVGQPQVTPNIQYPVICINQFGEMVIPESPGATDYHLQSLSPNIWLSTNNPTPNVPFPIIGNQLGYHQLLLTVSNACGSSSSVIYVEVVRCDGDGGGFEFKSFTLKSDETDLDVNIFPNPANEFIEILCSNYIPGTRIAASLISTDGKLVKTIQEYSSTFKVDLADLQSGLYVLQLNVNGTIFLEKVIKL